MPAWTEIEDRSKLTGNVEPSIRLKLLDHEKKAFDIFSLSFRFSQGVPGTQGDILQWLSAKGYLDDLILPKKSPGYAYNVPVPSTHRERFHVKIEIENDIERAWAYFYNAKEGKEHIDANNNLPYILHGILKQDINFQDKERSGRIADGKPIEPDSKEDPHASHIRKYALNGSPTGHDAFNHLFKDLRAFMSDPIALGSFRRLSENPTPEAMSETPLPGAIQELRTKWEGKHPGVSFFPQTKAA